jgi:hypothetical protein
MEDNMIQFETLWRHLVVKNVKQETNQDIADQIKQIDCSDPVQYSREMIASLKDLTVEDKIKNIMCNSACHMPHEKLDKAKKIYQNTGSIKLAHKQLLEDFKKDIKQYKQLSDTQVDDIVHRGWGAAGVIEQESIIATKIPSEFHEYFKETDKRKKAYYYCHCPRIKKELLGDANLDSLYCYCGGGFYKDIWEFITEKDVKITVLKSLFDGQDTCQFKIDFN